MKRTTAFLLLAAGTLAFTPAIGKDVTSSTVPAASVQPADARPLAAPAPRPVARDVTTSVARAERFGSADISSRMN